MMKLFIDNINTDHLAAKRRLSEVKERLSKLQEEQQSSKEELGKLLESEIEKAIELLASHLKSREVIESFCKWDTDELPEIEGSWEVTESAINKLVQNRLRRFVEEWEGEKQCFAQARKSVVTFFLSKYNYVERELHELEVNVMQRRDTTGKKTKPVENQFSNNVYDTSLTVEEKIIIGIWAPFMVPVALVTVAIAVPVTLLVLPALGIKSIVDQVQESKKKSTYNKDRSGFVRNQSQKYLKKVATVEALRPLVEYQLKQALLCLYELEAKIPRLIKADMELCHRLMDESQNKKDTEALYKPRKEKCERLRGELGLFSGLEIRGMHIAWNDLTWDVSEEVYRKNYLPPGIYQGRISKGRYASNRQVTLKVYKELLTTNNVTECLAEEATMR